MILNLLFSIKISVFTEGAETHFFGKLLAIRQMNNKDSGRVVVNSIMITSKE